MNRNVTSIAANESLSAAAQLMWDCDCGAIPVREPGSERVIGIITDRDICIATWSKGLAPGAIEVHGAMSSPAHFCSPNDTVATAESMMRAHKVRRLPVVDADGRLVGIISLPDIAKCVGKAQFRDDPDLSLDQFALTVGAICEERAAQSAA